MAAIVDRPFRRALHPLHAFLLGGAATLFLGALLADLAYASSYEIQWTNFASWLIVGALVLGAGVVAWAIVDQLRDSRERGRRPVYLVLVVATWALGLINALIHARDAWGGMPAGLVLSVVVVVLACAALWVAFAGMRAGDVP